MVARRTRLPRNDVALRELAKQTADATQDIRAGIEAIQGSAGRAVDSIAQISAVIQQVNNVSSSIAMEEQRITATQIAHNVAQTSAAASLVSQGVHESASSSQQITRNIGGVDQAARQTAQGVAQAQLASHKLSQIADHLQTLAQPFTV